MKKKKRKLEHRHCHVIMCQCRFFFAGCGARGDVSHDVEMSGKEWAEQIAKEAGKGRTDTASDLGLLILNEDYYLDAGDLSYSGEKVEDLTIFGIYPGISVNAARRKLKAYGFYASPYGESENCLITGEGFGNVSIRFSAEDGIVTDITVRPFCALRVKKYEKRCELRNNSC